MSAKKLLSCVAGVFLLVPAASAMAQTTGSARPFHGALFAEARPQKPQNSLQELNVSAFVLEAYDDNLFATLGGNVDPRSRPVDGFYSMLMPGVDYRFTSPRIHAAVTEASALGYYPDVHEVRSISHNLGAGFSAQAGPRTTILVNQTAAYSPSYLYGLFPSKPDVTPGDPMPDSPNYAVNASESYSYGTTAAIQYGLSQKTTAVIGGNYRYTDFTHETALQRDQTSQGLDGQLSYQRTRSLSYRFGYHYLTGNMGYGGAVDAAENRLEGGISYSRALSATRRLTASFNMGASLLNADSAPPEFQVPDHLYRASADASIDYPFSLYWSAQGAFRRGLEIVPGLAQPVYSNGVSAGLEGLLHRRVELGLAGGYSQGRSALNASASAYDTYNGSARLQYALTRSTAVHVEYFYYFYDFLGDVLVVSGGPQRMQRNGVRVGLRMLVPAFGG